MQWEGYCKNTGSLHSGIQAFPRVSTPFRIKVKIFVAPSRPYVIRHSVASLPSPHNFDTDPWYLPLFPLLHPERLITFLFLGMEPPVSLAVAAWKLFFQIVIVHSGVSFRSNFFRETFSGHPTNSRNSSPPNGSTTSLLYFNS